MRNRKKFDELWKVLFAATCPESLFGEDKKMSLQSYEKIRTEKLKHFEEISKNPKDSSEEFSVSLAKQVLLRLDEWAKEKIKQGTYGNYAPYRLKIIFEVRNWQNKKHFFLVNDRSVHAKELKALCFSDGYVHSDRICVLRGGIPVKTGYIREYGTHAATNHFFIGGDTTSRLYVKDFKLGDMLEIETWEYGTLKEFTKRFSRWLD